MNRFLTLGLLSVLCLPLLPQQAAANDLAELKASVEARRQARLDTARGTQEQQVTVARPDNRRVSPRLSTARRRLYDQRVARRLLRLQALEKQQSESATTASRTTRTTTRSTTRSTTTTSTTTASPSASAFLDTVFELTNDERTKRGLSALVRNTQLDRAAQLHAQDLDRNDYFSHENLQGERVAERATAQNYNYIAIGENIAKGQKTAEKVVTDWMNSPAHRENILSEQFDEIGLGFSRYSWVQNFGRNKETYQVPPSERGQLLNLLNDERTANGHNIIALNDTLMSVAQDTVENMAAKDQFMYTNRSGLSVQDQLEQSGYFAGYGSYQVSQLAGAGATTAQRVMELWTNSAAELEVINRDDFVHVGIGISGLYWLVIFSN